MIIECRKCGERKPLTEFNKDASKKLGVRRICKPCHRTEAAEYAAPRQAEYVARAKRWYAENKPRKKAYDAEWRKEYLQRRRDYFLAKTNVRRRRTRMAMPPWANKFFMEEAYRLATLRTQLTGIEWDVDHIVPILGRNVCGLHWEGNLQVIPRAVNQSKGNRLV